MYLGEGGEEGRRDENGERSLRPYHPERARSRPISEAKQGWAWLVLGWENGERKEEEREKCANDKGSAGISV